MYNYSAFILYLQDTVELKQSLNYAAVTINATTHNPMLSFDNDNVQYSEIKPDSLQPKFESQRTQSSSQNNIKQHESK